jgi:hypothetical protein
MSRYKYGYGQWFPVEQLRDAIKEHAMKTEPPTPAPDLTALSEPQAAARELAFRAYEAMESAITAWFSSGEDDDRIYEQVLADALAAAGLVITALGGPGSEADHE